MALCVNLKVPLSIRSLWVLRKKHGDSEAICVRPQIKRHQLWTFLTLHVLWLWLSVFVGAKWNVWNLYMADFKIVLINSLKQSSLKYEACK
jgi:hypothetical protein